MVPKYLIKRLSKFKKNNNIVLSKNQIGTGYFTTDFVLKII